MSYFNPHGNYGSDSLEERYPIGCRIELVSMPNEPDPVPSGMTGTVTWVDRMGISVDWDNGRTLSVIPGVDSFVRIP